ncbi:MAG: 2-hydroxychromene-2-carboxylate isomerase [Gammaproteobacteria bacterium]|nr:2-hydroxychromene-2-carboxylate isomerase [Gammaproteobacteria bacterium]
MKIEFFFDCSSPWTYLAFERFQPLAKEFNAELIWRPILVGGIFNQVNPGVEYFKQKASIPQRKLDYMDKDLQDWARATGIKLTFPPAGHPVNSVKVMRACLVLGPLGKLVAFAKVAFHAYFGEQRLISEDAVIADLCAQVEVDVDWLLAAISQQAVKDQLRANVDEAIARGAFGSPTMFLDGDDMYFGVDRIQLLRLAMQRKQGLTRYNS